MATCKECLHGKMCYIIEANPWEGDVDGVENDCNDFKDKTKYVEQKHARWNIVERNTNGRTVIVECGQCNAMFELLMFAFGMNYNHCPNCGAKMDGD